jgi:predicted lipid-binding transport protein (Tim44 family)/DNA-directed RNA polymerase subunit RPC12/RpoP
MIVKARPRHLVRCGWLATAGLVLAAASGTASAVAGGAGGFDMGGGGGDDFVGVILEIIFWILWSLPFPFNVLAIGLLLGWLWYMGRKVQTASGLNKIPSLADMDKRGITPPADFLQRNPGFGSDAFIDKVRIAFPAIQQAWMNQDLAPVRRWISDGVWQRFNTQFAMMRLLGQKNVVGNVEIRRVFIDAIEQDGAYDIIHAGIHFTASDDFVSAKFPELDQRGTVEMLEFWSFIRKSGVEGKDLYQSNLCPSCGATLPNDMGEVARCPHCKTLSSLGDYDWVLAEITQADDYANQNLHLAKSGRLTRRIRDALGGNADFAVQHIEDKAANAYMQILAAQVARQPERLRRFVEDALFGRLAQAIKDEPPFVFNRLYLNSVTLIDHYRQQGRDFLVVALKATAQRVDIAGEKLRLIDGGLYARNEIMILARDVGAERAKDSLYAHACPACGAPVGDTLDIRCGYCGSVLNSTSHEWIVTRLLKPGQYRQFSDEEQPDTATHVQAWQLDPLFATRDYAFNNILMILGCDGAISAEEAAFMQEQARSLGYNPKKVAGMLDLARNRKLALRLPEERRQAEKMLKRMEKAALADQRISPEEAALLEEVRGRIGAMA